MLSEGQKRWNRFSELAFEEWIGVDLNETQRNAQLCAVYAVVVETGGHAGYLDQFPYPPAEVAAALTAVGGEHFAENYLRAVREGKKDNFAATDKAFNNFWPRLENCLQAYVEAHRDEIFEGWGEE